MILIAHRFSKQSTFVFRNKLNISSPMEVTKVTILERIFALCVEYMAPTVCCLILQSLDDL